MTPKHILRTITSQRVQVAPGFFVGRPLPSADLPMVDPFLMLDHMGPKQLAPGEGGGTEDHPHRGFVAISYLFAGYLAHEDSLGNSGTLGPGDMQWMKAASGVVHRERMAPVMVQQGGLISGLQIWVNLPTAHKMDAPEYFDCKDAQLPRVWLTDKQSYVKVLAGEYAGAASPVHTDSPLLLYHISLQPGASVQLPIPRGWNSFAYVAAGAVASMDVQATQGQLLLYDDVGEYIQLTATNAVADVMLFAGQPLHQPVAQYGPFVMTNQRELYQAVIDYQEGRMGSLASA